MSENQVSTSGEPAPPASGERESAYRTPQPPPAASGTSAATPPTPPYPTATQPTTAQPYPTATQPTEPQPTVAQPYPGFPPPPPPTQPPGASGDRPVRRGVLLGVAALVIALTGGLVGGYVGYSLRPESTSPLQVPGVSGNDDPAPVIDRSSLSDIAASLQPAIVHIGTNQGEGSGVVISADGHIVTNNHVIGDARTVTVTFNSGQQISARVVGADARTDIAVIKVDADNLAFATWGNSDTVQVGDTVLAMGSPLGLQGSVTAGIVSGLHRTITPRRGPREDTAAGATIGDAIQTDAPINSGNSGGALVNTRGEVIGINTAIATAGTTGNIGVGFAISSNRARAVAEALIAGQPVGHPYLGVRITNAGSGGARIESVEDGGAAAQAGLVAGDVITRWGDRQIRSMEDLIGAIQASTVGAQVQVTIVRDGDEQTITVTVGEQQ